MLISIISSLTLVGISSYTFFNYSKIKESIQTNYGKWKLLNNMVSKKYDSRFLITIVSLYMIFKRLYLYFIQYMNNSVVKIDKNSYEVSYVINNKIHKMIVKPSRGPRTILKVLDEEETDITDEIEPFFGPNHDFHKQNITPKFFNKQKIIFHKYNGDKDIFEDEEQIVFI